MPSSIASIIAPNSFCCCDVHAHLDLAHRWRVFSCFYQYSIKKLFNQATFLCI